MSEQGKTIAEQAMRHRKPILRVVSACALIAYAVLVTLTLVPFARIAALLFAGAAAADMAEDPLLPRPRGTAMVALAAFTLPLEGGAQALAYGMTQASFIEIGIGVYLFAALLHMVRR